ncbi:MAG: hypothetical protein GX800_08825 [Clostridiaceae bacterium]|nr:hypothetical protein [Clostridiaceae bacterium]
MQGNKKLNLLPLSVKNKYINKYLLYAAILVCGICILAVLVQYFSMAFLQYDIKKIGRANTEYNEEKARIELLQIAIDEHKTFLQDYENGGFPLSRFMHDVLLHKPDSVSIISIDSQDRLMEIVETAETPADDTEDQPEEENVSEITPTPSDNSDLSGEEIIIRGHGKNSEDISKFIYQISRLSYIASADITAIEQHLLNNEDESIFEINLIGGVVD